MRKIAFVSHKGGVGKTTLAYHLMGEWASRGLKVLGVDLDFQANLTSGFTSPAAARGLDPGTTAAALAGDGPTPFAADLIIPSGRAGIDLIPGSLLAQDLDLADPRSQPPGRQFRIREALDELTGYDLVVLDCHPSGSLLAWGACQAATHAILPAIPDKPGVLGLAPVLDFLHQVRTSDCGNPGLHTLGIVVNRVEPSVRAHADYERLLRQDWGDLVFRATMPKRADLPKAMDLYMPVCSLDPRGEAAARVRAIADEVLERIERRAV